MTRLTDDEQRHVQEVLLALRRRINLEWAPLAAALGLETGALALATWRSRVTPQIADRIAKLVDVSLDELLAGRWRSPRLCPCCARPCTSIVHSQLCVGFTLLRASLALERRQRSDAPESEPPEATKS